MIGGDEEQISEVKADKGSWARGGTNSAQEGEPNEQLVDKCGCMPPSGRRATTAIHPFGPTWVRVSLLGTSKCVKGVVLAMTDACMHSSPSVITRIPW